MEGEKSLYNLQLKLPAVSSRLIKWCALVKEAVKVLEIVQEDVTLQSTLHESARRKMSTLVPEGKALQESLASKSDELSQ